MNLLKEEDPVWNIDGWSVNIARINTTEVYSARTVPSAGFIDDQSNCGLHGLFVLIIHCLTSTPHSV